MRSRLDNVKNNSCNNFCHLPIREAVVKRLQVMMDLFPRTENEKWYKPFPTNEYLISNWGRIIHLKSYGKKPHYLTPTIRLNKYPYVTFKLQGIRKGIPLLYLHKNIKQYQEIPCFSIHLTST